MSDLRRLTENDGNDPATQLLRSARADRAPDGAKDRARARLGLLMQGREQVAAAQKPQELALAHVRTKRKVSLDKPVLFQHISSGATMRQGGFGTMVVVLLQVAVLVVAPFVRPVHQVNVVEKVAAVHQEVPEITIVWPWEHRSTKASANDVVPPNDVQKQVVRKEGFAVAHRSVAPISTVAHPLTELVVDEEHASSLTEWDGIANTDANRAIGNSISDRDSTPPGKAIPFGADMTRPVRIAGRDPTYTRAALVARVQGTVVMKCIITEMGTAKDCLILKSLPHLDDAVLTAARTWRFSPVMLQGRPVAAQYIFRFHFRHP